MPRKSNARWRNATPASWMLENTGRSLAVSAKSAWLRQQLLLCSFELFVILIEVAIGAGTTPFALPHHPGYTQWGLLGPGFASPPKALRAALSAIVNAIDVRETDLFFLNCLMPIQFRRIPLAHTWLWRRAPSSWMLEYATWPFTSTTEAARLLEQAFPRLPEVLVVFVEVAVTATLTKIARAHHEGDAEWHLRKQLRRC